MAMLTACAGLVALSGACDEELLGPERFAWDSPEARSAGLADAGDSDGVVADAGNGDVDSAQDVDAGPDVSPDVQVDVGPPPADSAPGDSSGKSCATDQDCVTLDDGDRCNGIWSCQAVEGVATCAPKPSSAVKCDASKDTTCAVAACDPDTGACNLQTMADGTSCDDGDPCSGGDACKSGACVAGIALACACTQDADCAALDDGDPCNGTMHCGTKDGAAACLIDPASTVSCAEDKNGECIANACDKSTGKCVMGPINEGGACKVDGDKCAASTQCQAGQCLAADAGSCDDGNSCTLNACDPVKGCVFKSKAVDGNACDADGKPCASADVCKGGGCQAGPAKDCDDGDPCTSDLCDPDTGACQHKKSC